MRNRNYSLAIKTAIYNVDAKNFIGITHTSTCIPSNGKSSFLDDVGLSRHSSTPILATSTYDSKSYAMLLSGLVMMAFIACNRRRYV